MGSSPTLGTWAGSVTWFARVPVTDEVAGSNPVRPAVKAEIFMTEMPKNNLEDFQKEIRGLQEEQKTGERISEDLTQTLPQELTERDMEMWRIVHEWRDSSLRSEEMRDILDEYTQGFLNEEGELQEGVSEGRYAFLWFVLNKAQDVVVRRQMEELEKEGGI